MKKTITRGDVTITLDLNADESVNLRKIMKVKCPDFEKEMYPTASDKNPNLGLISDQFELVEADRKFEAAYNKAVSK